MPQFKKAELKSKSKEYGFNRDTFEKVYRLKFILDFINTHKYLKNHLLLKGGTAINLTVFELPRLSVDIDLDYIPNDTKDDMEKNRDEIKFLILNYMESEGYILAEDSRFTYSLDGFHFQYINAGGNKDTIKIEINYSLRAHMFEPVQVEIIPRIFDEKMSIRTLYPLEIFAAKTNALLNRAAARDLYDFVNMIDAGLFEDNRDIFRKAVIFYASISADTINKTFDTKEIDTIDFAKIKRELFPVIEVKAHFDLDGMKKKAKEYISDLMVLTDDEKEYLTQFEQKKYLPELLFDDAEIVERVKEHPMALWKCRA